ncbi:MAG: alanine racemase [Proteobacteria bacterium]|nr:alanine racemase [Pseudomonadota bacterium]
MTERINSRGIKLRPHMKTAKCFQVAELALDGNFGGITVSTLKEAGYFHSCGLRDILYAVCISPQKLEHVAALRDQGCNLTIITDSAVVARYIAAENKGIKYDVMIEIDCGESRTGIPCDNQKLLDVATILQESFTANLLGVITHAGHSYACRTEDDMAAVAEQERAAAVRAAERIIEAGIPCPTVSTGSTPCVMFARDVTGVTEVRPGVYMFGDLFQAGLGTRAIDEIAISVLATVMAHGRDANQIYIDAGGLALSKDRSTKALDGDCGYGLVCDVATAEPIPGLRVASVHQEHGQVTGDGPVAFDDLPVGSKVRVLPNHVCMTAAAYDAYHVIDSDQGGGGTEVIATWGRCNGW